MTLKLLFIADPLNGFRIYKDSTFAMLEDAARRGHTLWVSEPRDLAWIDGRVRARATRIILTGVAHDSEPHASRGDWYEAVETSDLDLAHCDGVVMRKDPPFDLEYVNATYLLERAEALGAKVFNRPRAIRDHNEKFAISEFAQFTAPTLVTRSAERVRAFHAVHRDIILKPLDGMGGMGIFRIGADGLNLGSIIETLGANGARTVMAQRYIPEIADGDKRILLIGGRPVPFCLARIPQAGETRGNLAAGGTGVARPLTAGDQSIAETLAPLLFGRGLLLVGLDVIGAHLTEVNVTSPTCFREIMDQTGFNVAAMMIDALEDAIAGRPQRTHSAESDLANQTSAVRSHAAIGHR